MKQDIIEDTLESMKDYLPKLVAASAQIAEDIQTHQGDWLNTLVDYLEGIGWLTLAIDGIRKLNQRFLEKCDTSLLLPLIDQVSATLEQQDFVSLSDLLQYELQPLLQSYDDELRGIVL